MDFGIQYKNYQSDMTRVCFIGKPQPKIASIYHIVLEAQLAGIRAIKQGAVAKQVDNAARSVITREDTETILHTVWGTVLESATAVNIRF